MGIYFYPKNKKKPDQNEIQWTLLHSLLFFYLLAHYQMVSEQRFHTMNMNTIQVPYSNHLNCRNKMDIQGCNRKK